MTTIAWWWQGGCHETEQRLSDHLEGELRGLRRRRILGHLARCELCRAALQSLRRTVEELRQIGAVELAPSQPLVDAVLARIRLDYGATL
jgi:anti-sigma factor RsiW